VINARNHKPSDKTAAQIIEDADTGIGVAHKDGDVVMIRVRYGVEEWLEVWTPEEAEDIAGMINRSALAARKERSS
jgi:hypothetical protein